MSSGSLGFMNSREKVFSWSFLVELMLLLAYVVAQFFIITGDYSLWLLLVVYLWFMAIYWLCFTEGWAVPYFFALLTGAFYLEISAIKEELRKYTQNKHTEAVIILTNMTWFEPDSFKDTSFLSSDIRAITTYLKKKKQDFSFFTNPSLVDVEKIMADKNVEEVYFVGHGDTEKFKLSSRETVYYSQFDDFDKYRKEYVHQLHCGSLGGKKLMDYVVPKKNHAGCIFFPKEIFTKDIKDELKSRAELL